MTHGPTCAINDTEGKAKAQQSDVDSDVIAVSTR